MPFQELVDAVGAQIIGAANNMTFPQGADPNEYYAFWVSVLTWIWVQAQPIIKLAESLGG